MKDLIRIGIIGAGANTKFRHIPGFQAIDGVTVDVVCNRSGKSSLAVAKQFHIPRLADAWEQVVADPDLEAICIGTWPYLHARVTIAALENGKHVLTEARMARNAAEAESMLEASRRHPDRVAQIVPGPISFDFDETIREWVEGGKLGNIYEVRVLNTGGQCALPETLLTWRQDFELSGCNILSMGIFHESVERWIPGEPAWIVADAAVFTKERTRPGEVEKVAVEIPDSVSVWGQYASGARLIYHFSGVESGKPRGEVRINGSKGALRFDLLGKRLYAAEAGADRERLLEIPEEKKRGWRVEADFIDSIRNGTPVTLTGFEQGVRLMRFTEAVRRSWKNGNQRVEL